MKVLLSHPSHLSKLAELLKHTTSLETLLLEHLQPPGPHAQPMVVNLDLRDLLEWLPRTVHTLKVKGCHLLRRVVLDPQSQQSWHGATYPHLRYDIVFLVVIAMNAVCCTMIGQYYD